MNDVQKVYVPDAVRGLNLRIQTCKSGVLNEFYELPGVRGARAARVTLIRIAPIALQQRGMPSAGLITLEATVRIMPINGQESLLSEYGVVAHRRDVILGVDALGWFMPTHILSDDHSLGGPNGGATVLSYPDAHGRHVIGVTLRVDADSSAYPQYDGELGYTIAVEADPIL